jgi:predicted transcriptional regulator
VLGSLEREVLASLRVLNRATAREVRDHLEGRGYPLAYTTVSTILGRLHAKGLVSRRRETCRGGERFVYQYVDFEKSYLDNVLRGVVSLFGSAGVAHLSEEIKSLKNTEERELKRRLGLG